ncbi:GGDEF domain-containing protein [Roseivivax sp. GX 12232]|uniref:sensor domain-containing diguanylate cyclase n=1 Tax=Roseivivax sp. GX 12232 TaxID=2900547 RepID=UPI001E46615F|nr:GGDEF domain-containing protein [Roseivivax sp. GX 12232]MCE0505112.1 GGDEF domain-containing protein [Roseivivax sp. GX 12232]
MSYRSRARAAARRSPAVPGPEDRSDPRDPGRAASGGCRGGKVVAGAGDGGALVEAQVGALGEGVQAVSPSAAGEDTALAPLAALFGDAPRRIIVCDRVGRVIYLNPAARASLPSLVQAGLRAGGSVAGAKAAALGGSPELGAKRPTPPSGPDRAALRALAQIAATGRARVLSLTIAGQRHAMLGWRVGELPGLPPGLVVLKDAEPTAPSRGPDPAARPTAAFEEERRRLRSQAAWLSRMATADALTGLLNAAGFEQRCAGRLTAGKGAAGGAAGALVFLDIDRFKQVNDRFGHPAGNSVLTEIGSRLRAALGPRDLAARIGGDEFALWLEGARPEALPRRLNALRDALDRPVAHLCPAENTAQEIPVSLAIGAATAPGDGVGYALLLALADDRMYADKRARQARASAGHHSIAGTT